MCVNVLEEKHRFEAEEIRERITPKSKAILVNSPSNPGMLLSPDRMSQIAQIGPYVISGEIYHGLVYGKRSTPFSSSPSKGRLS
ncbi:MAG: aminotransferase class I/II-fold pyridoxal phosphate-dependent enzyme [Desulfobacterales bacterium]|nr:aminotransferase class I/II-fold pyridoxal phosphate-dependent enzyme [Desulfobacterales bacterium]